MYYSCGFSLSHSKKVAWLFFLLILGPYGVWRLKEIVLGHSTGKQEDWGGLGAGGGTTAEQKIPQAQEAPSALVAWGSSPSSTFKWTARSRKITT